MRFLFYFIFITIFISLSTSGAFAQVGTPPVYLKFRADKIYVLDAGRIEFVADLYVGTWENPVFNLYAATFDLNFQADIVLAEQTTFTYYPQSFLGSNDDVTVFNKSPQEVAKGNLNISLSRNDGKSVSGFGKIGEVHFITIADIIGSRNVEETPFNVKMEYVKLWDIDRNELPHEIAEDGTTIIIVNDILARNNQRSNLRQIEIYPNPSREELNINLQNVRGERIELFNAAGQRVKSDRVRGDRVQLSTSNLHPGLYTVKVHTEEGVITRRILVQ